MTTSARAILSAFASRFARSAQARGGRAMRIAGGEFPWAVDSASPDEKEAFLAAVEDLDRCGIVKANWKRHRQGEELASLTLVDPDAAFELLGRESPDRIIAFARERAIQEAAELGTLGRSFLNWLGGSLGPEDGVLGIDESFMVDLAHLARVAETGGPNLQLRALSIHLYHDSKRLEALLPLVRRLAQRADRAGQVHPDFSNFERSWPESAIAGNITINFEGGRCWQLGGSVAGLPLSTLSGIRSIEGPGERGRALSVENKESFHILSRGTSCFDCIVYTGGHLNEAARLLVSILARSGFDIAHAGDIDPDGFLILEEVGAAAGIAVEPWYMDLAVFNRYRSWARNLEPSIVARLSRISKETLDSPTLGPVVRAIRDTGLGIEQEIIDYER